ncbi:MAG: hypothetical protein EOO16_12400 [Chitinophagaceae bacterium]|nr:MAG: hypothetical protein EOO16_12400 [Chitinophagaceae bacterium]
MRKLWLMCLAMLCAAACPAQSFIRDNLFNLNLPTSTINVRDMVIYSDKRILIGGEFHTYQGSFTYNRILRLAPNGTPDPTFTVPTVSGGRINCIAVQPWDSAIIIAGSFTTVNGSSRNGIARLLPTGALDASFNPGSGISGSYAGELIVWAVGVRNDADASKRRIIAGGQFNYFNGTLVSAGNGGGLVQLKTDGSLDNAALPIIDGGPVYALTVDENGKILAGGEFYRVNGADCWRFVRINTNGSTDNTLWTGRWDGFNSSVGNVQVYGGKIYVGGYFTQYRGNSAGRLVRINTDGSYDATFNTTTGFGGSTSSACTQGVESKSLAFMTNGKLVVGGNFTDYKGNTAYRVARLNTDGSYDATCITGTGFDHCVMRVAFQGTDDSLVLGGFFTSFKGETQGTIIRIRKPPSAFTLAAQTPQLQGWRQDGRVQLSWDAAGTGSSSTHELLRSEDGRNFRVVHRQRGNDGQPTYVYSDAAPGTGTLWYQVVITEASGRQVQSPVVEIHPGGRPAVFFPNPCTDRLQVSLPGTYSGAVVVDLKSAAGAAQPQQRLQARGGVVEIRTSALPAGAWFVTVRNQEGALLGAGPVLRSGR